MTDNYILFGVHYERREEVPGVFGVTELVNKEIGRFYISLGAESEANVLNKDVYWKLLSVIHEYSLSGRPIAFYTEKEKTSALNFMQEKCTPLTIAETIELFPKDIFEKQERILTNLFHMNDKPGATFHFNNRYITYADDDMEIRYLLAEMLKNNYLTSPYALAQVNKEFANIYLVQIGHEGWRFLKESMSQGKSNKQVFVAMWFDASHNDTYLAIEKAIRHCGFNPLRIDNKQHNNEISGEILYEIKNSRFLVADVTGQRQGVYFEAGYAKGLNIPVIWACHESEIDKVHFDTRQYNHIIWDSPETLQNELINRIKGTIL